MTLAREEQRRIHPLWCVCHDAEHVRYFLCGVQWLKDVPLRYLTTSVFRVQQPHRQAIWSETHHVMVGRPVMPDHDQSGITSTFVKLVFRLRHGSRALPDALLLVDRAEAT